MKQYISILQTDAASPRQSTLQTRPHGRHLAVLGILPHGYTFRPKTRDDRDALVNYLMQMEYKS